MDRSRTCFSRTDEATIVSDSIFGVPFFGLPFDSSLPSQIPFGINRPQRHGSPSTPQPSGGGRTFTWGMRSRIVRPLSRRAKTTTQSRFSPKQSSQQSEGTHFLQIQTPSSLQWPFCAGGGFGFKKFLKQPLLANGAPGLGDAGHRSRRRDGHDGLQERLGV